MISFLIPFITFSFFSAIIYFQPRSSWAAFYLKDTIFLFSSGAFTWIFFYLINKKIRLTNYPNFRTIKNIRYETILYATISILFSAFFYYFRTNRFYPPPLGNGDSLLLLENIPVYSSLFGYLDSIDEILTLFIHSKLYLFFKEHFSASVQTTMAYSSIGAGGFYLFFFLKFIKRTGGNFFLGITFVILTPAIELFAGYIENYTFAYLFISLTFFEGIFLLKNNNSLYSGGNILYKEKNLLLISILSAIAFLLHIIGGLMIFSLAYLVWKRTENRRNFVKLSAIISIPPLLIIGTTWMYFLFFSESPVSMSESFLLNPPFLRPSKIFSINNVNNFLNYMLLSSPFAISILIYIFYVNPENLAKPQKNPVFKFIPESFRSRLAVIAPNPEHKFLLIGTISYMFLIFIHNPMIGLPADWDLHSFFHIPLNLYIMHILIPRNITYNPEKRSIVGAAFILNLFMTFTWIFFNSRTSAESINNLIRAERNTTQLLVDIRTDDLFEKISNLSRKKTYVKVLLFQIRSENFLNEILMKPSRILSSKEIQEINRMMRSLHSNTEDFNSIILLPEKEFNQKLPPIWTNLSSINAEIAAMQKIF